VWPRRDQVRQRCGRWLTPLSSMKMIVRPSRRAFFKGRPAHPAPAPDLLLVSLPRPAGGPLGAPPQPDQDLPDVARVILNPELVLDQMGHPGTGPQRSLISPVLRSPEQQLLQTEQIPLPQLGLPPSPPGLLQGRFPALAEGLHPPTHGLPSHPKASGHLGQIQPLPHQPQGLEAALFQGREITPHSRWVTHIG
jgi:hypothetical protein